VSNQDFERERICYEQNCQHLRSLSQIMWQLPIIAMTLTGGLWYGVATLQNVDPILKDGSLTFAALANTLLIIMINRVRDVMAAYLKAIEDFYPTGFARTHIAKRCFPLLRERGACTTFSILMGVAAAMSALAIFLV